MTEDIDLTKYQTPVWEWIKEAKSSRINRTKVVSLVLAISIEAMVIFGIFFASMLAA